MKYKKLDDDKAWRAVPFRVASEASATLYNSFDENEIDYPSGEYALEILKEDGSRLYNYQGNKEFVNYSLEGNRLIIHTNNTYIAEEIKRRLWIKPKNGEMRYKCPNDWTIVGSNLICILGDLQGKSFVLTGDDCLNAKYEFSRN